VEVRLSTRVSLVSEEDQVHAIPYLLRQESDGHLNFGRNGDLRYSSLLPVAANRALYLFVGQFT